ncbi:TRAP transporter permease [Litorivicinus lipolyticus]|uniref:TRAP transporter permease n=1 Tax=Litorivicinus lipolyticus TaxID=418701 RepID=UPI003B5A515A
MRERLVSAIAIALGVFIFYTSLFGAFETLIQRATFVAAIVTLGLLLNPSPGRFGWAVDLVLWSGVIGSVVYVIYEFENIMNNLPIATRWDVAMAFYTLSVVLIIAYRVSSWIFPGIVGVAVSYGFFGDLIPGTFGHRGFDAYYITEVIFLGDKGLWGMLVSVASTTLAAFVLFGALLLNTGAGNAFFKLARRIAGRSRGGAAKVATVASAFFSTISGSTVANVATTGNFTIPLMKRLNYPPAFAGGVEAIASTGGQLMPPIMGTAAFVMAELVGVNYWSIVASAFIPAVVFYIAILMSIHLAAAKQDIQEIDIHADENDTEALTWQEFSPVIAGFAGIILGVFSGFSIGLTACLGMLGIMGAFVVSQVMARTAPKQIGGQIVRAFESGGKGVVIVGILLVSAQVFVSMINLTGIGVTISGAILEAAGGNLIVVTVVMAVVCLIAGMGLPTSAAYVLVAAVFAPALISQGFDALPVHLFVLYFACLSVITPPVCVGAFVAATIAETSWLQVAKYAVLLGAGCYCVPFLFFAYPGILLTGGPVDIATGIGAGLILALAIPKLIFGLGGGLIGVCQWLMSVLAIATLFVVAPVAIAAGVVLSIASHYKRAVASSPDQVAVPVADKISVGINK